MIKTAVLAGGCFWGVQELIRHEKGVVSTRVGYTGGPVPNPTYENHEGHAEAVEVTYDDSVLSYMQLLDFFFRIHNPTLPNQQGNDIGTSYRSAIFYANQEEKEEAEKMIAMVDESGKWKIPVVTNLEPLTEFYPAEEYHQDYLQKNPRGYTCHAVWVDSFLA